MTIFADYRQYLANSNAPAFSIYINSFNAYGGRYIRTKAAPETVVVEQNKNVTVNIQKVWGDMIDNDLSITLRVKD